jgi:hypothetical protein
VAEATTQGDEPVIDVAVDRPEERSEADVTLITRASRSPPT